MNDEIRLSDVVVLFCPPLSQYPEQPSDITKCELVDCPICKQPMWFSEKKKALKEMAEKLGKEIIWECFVCFKDRVQKNPELIKDHVRVDI